MPDGLHRLRRRDIGELVELLEKKPIENLFLLSRLVDGGFNIDRLGCCLYGYWSNGRLIDVCHDGVNIVLASVNDELTDEAVGGFVRRVGPIRKASAIMGSSTNVEKFFRTLASAWPRAWARPREIRARQPLLAIGNTSLVAADERVCRIGPENYRPYFEAAVKMYTEELGISPLDEFNSYQSYISRLIRQGRSFGACEDGEVWFKTDIGCSYKSFCQIQGVWVAPELRGRGLGVGALAKVIELCALDYDVVSLYVNDYNTSARRLYEKVGFQEFGCLGTILY